HDPREAADVRAVRLPRGSRWRAVRDRARWRGAGHVPSRHVDRSVLLRGHRWSRVDRGQHVRCAALPAHRLRAREARCRERGDDPASEPDRWRAAARPVLPPGRLVAVRAPPAGPLPPRRSAAARRARAEPRRRPPRRGERNRRRRGPTGGRDLRHRERAVAMTAILEVSTLDASYGPVQILFGLDLQVDEGEIVALLGTNGAGKSTLFKCITGLLPVTRGAVRFRGEDITNLATEDIAAHGVVMMPGGRSVFPTLTVRDNLRLACWLMRHDAAAVRAAEERVLTLFPRLADRIDQLAGNLSGGEQQMLAISQALIPDPQLLLIDELSLGLAPTVVGQLIDVVHQIHATGLTIVVVEQSVNVALRLAERAVFMEKGEVRFTGPTVELLDRPDILRSVFIEGAPRARTPGQEAPRTSERQPPPADAPVVLQCRGVTKRFGGITAVDGVDLELRRGQILGLIGQNGAGKTTLF